VGNIGEGGVLNRSDQAYVVGKSRFQSHFKQSKSQHSVDCGQCERIRALCTVPQKAKIAPSSTLLSTIMVFLMFLALLSTIMVFLMFLSWALQHKCMMQKMQRLSSTLGNVESLHVLLRANQPGFLTPDIPGKFAPITSPSVMLPMQSTGTWCSSA